MAQHVGRLGPWPRMDSNTGAGRNSPNACFQTPDGMRMSERSLAGPLRMGTSPGVGPRGGAVATERVEGRSDFGMDRVSPRWFDPMGTITTRSAGPGSELVSSEIRGKRRS